MVVLGIDPGTETTGFGIVDQRSKSAVAALDYGVIHTSAGSPLGERLKTIHNAVGEMVAQYRPALMVIEKLFFKKNITSAIAVGHARGVVLLAAAQAGIPVAEYTPPEIKVAVTGYGGAAKAQMMYMVGAQLNIAPDAMRDDAADALAAALCGIYRSGR